MDFSYRRKILLKKKIEDLTDQQQNDLLNHIMTIINPEINIQLSNPVMLDCSRVSNEDLLKIETYVNLHSRRDSEYT